MARSSNNNIAIRPHPSLDGYEVMYGCGHVQILTRQMLTALNLAPHQAAPKACPTCEKSQLERKWVEQQEAKLWNADPNWKGFAPAGLTNIVTATNTNPYWAQSATASSAWSALAGTLTPQVETGPLAWLDWKVNEVTRRCRV